MYSKYRATINSKLNIFYTRPVAEILKENARYFRAIASYSHRGEGGVKGV